MSQDSRQIGKYTLQELLGRGGMAEVWKAFDTQLHRYVAIKLLHANLQTDPDFVSRFTHEAQTVAALRHPNIIQIYDFHISEPEDAENTTAYMVMEYIKGQTLAHYIRATSQQKLFPAGSDIVRLFTPISLALDYAHQQGTIHRDIKPANILLDHNNRTRNGMGEPLLSDFGLAKVLDAPSQTMAGVVFGTPLYISPEQVQNQPISNRTDLYSLGIVLYEIFTSKPPFQGGSSSSLMLQHVIDKPADPRSINPDLSVALAQVLLKGISREPQNRFPSASAMTAALAEALDLSVPDDLKQALEIQRAKNEAAPVEVDDAAETVVAAASLHNVDNTPTRQSIDPAEDDNAGVAVDLLSADSAGPTSDATHWPDSEGTATVAADSGAIVSSLHGGQEEEKINVADTPVDPAPILPVLPAAAGGRKKRQGLRIAAVVALIVVLIGAGVGAFFVLASPSHKTVAAVSPNASVGQAFFLSSVAMNQTSIQGNNDKLQINLTSIPVPQKGKSYYGWLLPDKNHPEASPVLLGRLPVNNGKIHFVYSGNQTASDLLGMTSRFLITEESSAIMPYVPSPDLSAWRYYAEIPQTVPAGQQYSLLDHLRHLLSNDPDLIALHINGGLDIWAARNTQKVAQWSGNAQHDWKTNDYSGLKHNVISMLDYLDGSSQVHQDVPWGTPLYASKLYSQVGLLELDPGLQNPPSYLYHIALHLNGVLSSPGSTSYQRSLAVQINTGLNSVSAELGQVRQDAIKLEQMSDQQLAQPSSLNLINAMQAQANLAYLGRVDPHTKQVTTIGMQQVYLDNQRLATFDVKPYHS